MFTYDIVFLNLYYTIPKPQKVRRFHFYFMLECFCEIEIYLHKTIVDWASGLARRRYPSIAALVITPPSRRGRNQTSMLTSVKSFLKYQLTAKYCNVTGG